jgi:truncated hemoglobin YjbI
MPFRPKALIRGAVVLAAAVSLIGCGDDSPTMSSQTLFEKYGGAPTIRTVVDNAVTALVSDPVTAPFFAGTLATPGRPDRLKSCLRLQFTAVFGGPATYPGRNDQGDMCADMVTAHRGLNISGAVFDRFIMDVAVVLRSAGVSEADVNAVAPTLVGLRPQIVS